MSIGIFKSFALLLTFVCFSLQPVALSGASSADLLKAKKEAEAKGFIFETSHDEIVAKAKKEEGMLQVLSSWDPDIYPRLMEGFMKKYPFRPVVMLELTGTEGAQRFVLELKAGGAGEFDIAYLANEVYPDMQPYAKKFDILGMAEHGVLNIPSKMVDPKHRTIVGLGNGMSAVAFNKNLIAADKVPDTWEGFLKPEFKGRKFLVDVRPIIYAIFASCPDQGMGVEWMVNYAKKIAAQEPVWVRGNTRHLTAIMAGEHALHSGTYYHSAMRLKEKDPMDILQVKLVEPLPIRVHEPEMVLATSANPYSALLFLEYQASLEAQRIVDKHEPLKASIHTPGSALNKISTGKKVCLNGFDTYEKSSEWMEMAVKGFGFPKPE